ncbi:type II toxin-antitoxin system death-on-curing family toxin [Planctomycetota bacterium]
MLIALWDKGYHEAIRKTDRLKDTTRVRRSIELAARRGMHDIAYWMAIFDLYEPELRALLNELLVPVEEKEQQLSCKAVSRLTSEAHKRGIDPITGNATLSGTCHEIAQAPTLSWRTEGHPRDLRWLTEAEVIKIHYALVLDFSNSKDPIEPAGLRERSLLISAVFCPRTVSNDVLKYPTVEMSAAALLHSIIRYRPFHNGNKRTALVAMLVFLDENGFSPTFDQDEAFKFILDVAQYRITNPQQEDNLGDREVLGAAQWLCEHCQSIEKGDHPISHRKLRRILTEYNCTISNPFLSRIEIVRETIEPGRFWRKKRITKLNSQITYDENDHEISENDIERIRKDLHLDDIHGIDNHAFYNKGSVQATDFITHYRKALRRIAKY